MCENKSIEIRVNEVKEHTILSDARSISAKEIYQVLDYNLGDKYTISSKNSNNLDGQVLAFFEEMLKKIIDGVNSIPLDEKS